MSSHGANVPQSYTFHYVLNLDSMHVAACVEILIIYDYDNNHQFRGMAVSANRNGMGCFHIESFCIIIGTDTVQLIKETDQIYYTVIGKLHPGPHDAVVFS